MEETEIYSSKKKSFLLFIVSLLFVVGGIYMFINAENPTGFRSGSPLVAKAIGIASTIFFSLGIYISAKQILSNRLLLIINRNGINVDPKKSLTEFIEWQSIKGFSELKIQGQKFVVIDVSNPDYWIDKEENRIRKKVMAFNVRNYGSPFNLSANLLQMNYSELITTFNENLNKYK